VAEDTEKRPQKTPEKSKLQRGTARLDFRRCPGQCRSWQPLRRTEKKWVAWAGNHSPSRCRVESFVKPVGGGDVMRDSSSWPLGACLCRLLGHFGPCPSRHHAWARLTTWAISQPTVKGTVTLFDWANPHVWISMESEGRQGNIEKWNARRPQSKPYGHNRLG